MPTPESAATESAVYEPDAIASHSAGVAAVEIPPSEIESDEPPLESSLHLQQLLLLLAGLNWHWQARHDFFAAGNLTVYYNTAQLKTKDMLGPDFFVVLNTERRPRKSWVVWAEDGVYPHVIIELLSDSTARNDRGRKKAIYQDTFRTPDYFWFDPESLEFRGFHLANGQYQELVANAQGWLWSQQLQLYLGVCERQLRFFTPEGQRVPTPEEAASQAQATVESERQRADSERQRADAEQRRAEAERQRADIERQRCEQLERRLRELGIDPAAEA